MIYLSSELSFISVQKMYIIIPTNRPEHHKVCCLLISRYLPFTLGCNVACWSASDHRLPLQRHLYTAHPWPPKARRGHLSPLTYHEFLTSRWTYLLQWFQIFTFLLVNMNLLWSKNIFSIVSLSYTTKIYVYISSQKYKNCQIV